MCLTLSVIPEQVIEAKPLIALGCNVLAFPSLSMIGSEPAAQAVGLSLAQKYTVVSVRLLINVAVCGVQNKFYKGWSPFLAIFTKLNFLCCQPLTDISFSVTSS